METLGQQLFAIIEGTAVTPYPQFSGCQATMYAALVAAFNASSGFNVSDLRTDVYPNPIQYPLSTVYSIISELTQPSNLQGCQPADWTAVQSQIKTEVGYLVQLYGFQTAFEISAQSVASALNGSFSTASNALNNQGSGGINFLGILGAIVGLGSLFTDTAAISTIMGAYIAVAQNIQGADGLSGELATLQDQLATIVNQSNSAAANVYQPIAVDWGKLQQFEGLLPSLSAFAATADYQTIGNQYEISIYQAIIPSLMAVVYYFGVDWGTCANPQETGQGLGYTPSQYGQNGYNSSVCSRLTALGVSLADVCNRTGPWSSLPNWVCSSSREGSFCEQRK